MLRLSWNENEHIVIECVVKDEVVASLVIEESGDAVNKILHVATAGPAEVRVKA
jgi:hypothetical protein